MRRNALLMLTAGKGYKREARGLVGRAIKQALGVKRWGTAPYYVTFLSEKELADGGPVSEFSSRFEVYVTDAERERILAAIGQMAAAEGWNGAPVEAYHD
jgi:hypothetical protein